MKEKTNSYLSAFSVRWRKWIKNTFEKMAEILDTCEWFPGPRQMNQPPF